ncbi:MAG TPA: hypothetical protein GX699_10655 [Firmicutes bacterium]|nr:hypothetical protein [Bacillota bacterium]
MWCIHIQTELEKRGVPTVAIITDPFVVNAQSAAELFGVPRARRVVIGHPVANEAEKDTPRKIKKVYGDIINCLVGPLSEEEASSGIKKIPKRERIFARGTLETLQEEFLAAGLTDGLPVIIPTEEKVKEMLTGTSHSPDELIGLMPPENWEVTVEKVAINGVMAGCVPEHMPVLLAIAEAMVDPKTEVETFSRSTASFSFWAVVNGPIAGEIKMNSKGNALGPGCRANAVIGRSIRLFLINLGGSKPGVNDMSVLGSALKYGFAFAENEEESPWEPFHVTHGFKKEDSVVTVFKSWGYRSAAIGSPLGHGLANIAWVAQNAVGRNLLLVMNPLLAKLITREGLTKDDVRHYLWQSLQVTAAEWLEDADRPAKEVPKWYKHFLQGVMVPRFNTPRSFEIIVTGSQANPWYQIYEGVTPAAGTSKSIDKWR